MTCYISKQIAEHCDEPKPLICPECGSEHGTINNVEERLECESCGSSFWLDDLELIEED